MPLFVSCLLLFLAILCNMLLLLFHDRDYVLQRAFAVPVTVR